MFNFSRELLGVWIVISVYLACAVDMIGDGVDVAGLDVVSDVSVCDCDV